MNATSMRASSIGECPAPPTTISVHLDRIAAAIGKLKAADKAASEIADRLGGPAYTGSGCKADDCIEESCTVLGRLDDLVNDLSRRIDDIDYAIGRIERAVG